MTRLRSTTFLAIVLVWGLSILPPLDAVAAVSFEPDVRTGQLANGLTYYIQRTTGVGGNKVSVKLVVLAGHEMDEPGYQQTAHLVEHVVASHMPPELQGRSRTDWVQDFGGDVGRDGNAATSEDYTVYSLNLPARPTLLTEALAIARGWAGEVDVTEDVVRRERSAVREELRRGASPESRAGKTFAEVLAGGEPPWFVSSYTGQAESIERATPQSVSSFYRKWYRPDRQLLVVVGPVDPAEIEVAVTREFGGLARSTDAAPPLPRRSVGSSSLLATVPRPQGADSALKLFWARPKAGGESALRELAISRFAASMLNGRLAQLQWENVEDFSSFPFVNADLNYDLSGPAFGSLVQFAAPHGSEVNSITSVLALVNDLVSSGFWPSEFEAVSPEILNQVDANRPDEIMDEIVRRFREGLPLAGAVEGEAIRLRSVRLGDVNAAIRSWLGTSPRLVVETSEPLSGDTALREILTRSREMPSRPFVPPTPLDELSSAARASLPLAKPIMSERSGIFRADLEGSRTLILLKPDQSTDTPSDRDIVQISIIAVGGVENPALARAAADAIVAVGTDHVTPFDLIRLRRDRGLDHRYSIRGDAMTFAGVAQARDLDLLLDLFVTEVSGGASDAGSLERQLRLRRARARAPIGDRARFDRFIAHHLSSEHGPQTALPDVSPDEATQALNTAFMRADRTLVLITGRFDPTTVAETAWAHLASLPDTPASFVREAPVSPPTVSNVIRPESANRQIFRAGDQDSAVVKLIYRGATPAGSVGAGLTLEVLERLLQRRLTDRLREQESGVYAVSVALSRIDGGMTQLDTEFTCAPSNVERLIGAAEQEISQISADGFSFGEISGALQNALAERSTAFSWTLQAERAFLAGEDPIAPGAGANPRPPDAGDLKSLLGDLQERTEFIWLPELEVTSSTPGPSENLQ